jgi:hypothetical protein
VCELVAAATVVVAVNHAVAIKRQFGAVAADAVVGVLLLLLVFLLLLLLVFRCCCCWYFVAAAGAFLRNIFFGSLAPKTPIW